MHRNAITGCKGLEGKDYFKDKKFLENFIKYLQETRNAISLDLSENNIGWEQDRIMDSGHWTEGGGHIKISVPGIKYSLECIAEILGNNMSIKFLNISKNRLDDSHLDEIGQALKRTLISSNTSFAMANEVCEIPLMKV